MKILTIANIVERKRIDLCAKSCAELAKKHDSKELSWLVIGRGNKEEEIKKIAPDVMQFIPKVASLRDYYHAADVFVLPSCDEGFGMVYVEAIMCGCPVVCRRGDGGEEIVNKTGGGMAVDIPKSDEESVQNINEAIEIIVSKRSHYANEETKQLAREMVDPERISKDWLNLIRDSLASVK